MEQALRENMPNAKELGDWIVIRIANRIKNEAIFSAYDELKVKHPKITGGYLGGNENKLFDGNARKKYQGEFTRLIINNLEKIMDKSIDRIIKPFTRPHQIKKRKNKNSKGGKNQWKKV